MNTRAILMALAVVAACAAHADDLDFSKVGIYGRDFESCDFTCLKLYAPRDAETYAKYAAMIRAAHERGQYVLVGLYTYDRVKLSKPIEEYIANTDELLENLPLDLIDAVVPSEENIAWNNGLAVQNALYDHIKSKWGLTCYQWFTPYDTPHAGLRADGWIIDPYRLQTQDFRKYLMKYLVTGLPVINCVNASAEIGMWSSSQDQVDVCREFNVPMFFYAVDGLQGSPFVWMLTDEPRLAKWRGWFFRIREMCHATDTSLLPLASADFSPGIAVEVAGGEDNRFEYADDMLTLKFIDDATITGFGSLRWDGAAERLGVLAGERASLTYHFWSEFEMRTPAVEATFEPVGASGASLALSYSTDGEKFAETGLGETLTDFAGRNLWVRAEMTGGQAEGIGGWLSDLAVHGECVAPAERAVIIEPLNRRGKFEYRDDFESTRAMHVAQITGGEFLEWVRGKVQVRGHDGQKINSTLRWRFVAEKPMTKVRVMVESYSHRSLGAHNEVGVSLDGENVLVSETTSGRENASGRYVGEIAFDLSGDERFAGATELWVHFTMINTSGVRTGNSNDIRILEVSGTLAE